MTKEEKQKAIDALKKSAPVMAMTQEEFNDYIQTLNKIMDWLEEDPCSDTINKQELIDYIDTAIKATNMKDVYSCGMRNGMRLIKSFIDDKEPEYERCCQEEHTSEPNAVSLKVDGDVVAKYEYMFGSEEDDLECKTKVVMTKKIFQECYEKWIKPEVQIVCKCCSKEGSVDNYGCYK